jgi:hypothetical protein
MADDDIRLLIEALGGELQRQSNPTGVVAMLITETVRFRDKLKTETGTTLTVQDTRIALDSLEQYLEAHKLPDTLTPEQKALTQIYIDRITLFQNE